MRGNSMSSQGFAASRFVRTGIGEHLFEGRRGPVAGPPRRQRLAIRVLVASVVRVTAPLLVVIHVTHPGRQRG